MGQAMRLLTRSLSVLATLLVSGLIVKSTPLKLTEGELYLAIFTVATFLMVAIGDPKDPEDPKESNDKEPNDQHTTKTPD